MKKLALGLLGFLVFTGSLFAVTSDEVMNANPPYPRAFITQIDIRDSGELATKLNVVTYQYWDAQYPYSTLRYSGNIDNWYYTHDYVNFYYYSTYWDQYLDPNDLSVTYLYVNFQGYSTSAVTVEKYDTVNQEWNTINIMYKQTLPNGTRVYENNESASINQYRIMTTIQTVDGTVDLFNTVFIDRDAQ
jgi:hypothetical protein